MKWRIVRGRWELVDDRAARERLGVIEEGQVDDGPETVWSWAIFADAVDEDGCEEWRLEVRGQAKTMPAAVAAVEIEMDVRHLVIEALTGPDLGGRSDAGNQHRRRQVEPGRCARVADHVPPHRWIPSAIARPMSSA
jgi:hypothetical protein